MKKHPVLFSFLMILLIVGALSAAVIGWIAWSRGSLMISLKDQVALLEIKGMISEGKSVTDLVARYGEDTNIKAIILEIDSPGGGVAPSQEIFTEVTRAREQKPVVAYLGNVAASGGYYVAAGADKIVASPGTITGSIGVLFQLSNFEELLRKIGVDFSTLKAGKFKDVGSPYRAMSQEERELMENVLLNVHEQFIQDVARGRGISLDQVRSVADGRIMTGLQAADAGLVDELGNFQDALRITKDLAGIRGEISIVRPVRKRQSLLSFLMDELLDAFVRRLNAYTPQLTAFFRI